MCLLKSQVLPLFILSHNLQSTNYNNIISSKNSHLGFIDLLFSDFREKEVFLNGHDCEERSFANCDVSCGTSRPYKLPGQLEK